MKTVDEGIDQDDKGDERNNRTNEAFISRLVVNDRLIRFIRNKKIAFAGDGLDAISQVYGRQVPSCFVNQLCQIGIIRCFRPLFPNHANQISFGQFSIRVPDKMTQQSFLFFTDT